METARCAHESPMSGRRQNLARDLNASDLAVRRSAEERLPEFLGEAFEAAMVVLHNRQDAQDALGDALTKWLRNPAKYNDNYKASDLTWFKTVVRHTAIDHLRRRYLKQTLPEDIDSTSIAEMVELLYLAIAALEEPHQRVLREYLDWDDAPSPTRIGVRLGKALGVSDKTAKARFTNALAALRREMHRLMETPGTNGGSARADRS
jgi:RNA polymerase sigma factor (sigma-70 family)